MTQDYFAETLARLVGEFEMPGSTTYLPIPWRTEIPRQASGKPAQ